MNETPRSDEVTQLKEELEQCKSKISQMEDLSTDMDSIRFDHTPLEYDEHVYILTSKRYYKLNLFKIGKTINLKNRLVSLNTGNVLDDDEMFYLCSIKTADSQALEKQIHKTLKNFHFRKEFFQMNPVDLMRVVQTIAHQQEELRDIVNITIQEQTEVKEPLSMKQFVANAKKAPVSSTDPAPRPAVKKPQVNPCIRWLLTKRTDLMRKNDMSEHEYSNTGCYEEYVAWAEERVEMVLSQHTFTEVMNKTGFALKEKKVKQPDGRRTTVRCRKISFMIISHNLVDYIQK
jgi:hypothetical protein